MHNDLGSDTPRGAPAAIDLAAREQLLRVLETDLEPQALDPATDLAEGYGLTSLNKILFLMGLCEETGVPLAAFTESDVAAMRTLADVVAALAPHAPQEA